MVLGHPMASCLLTSADPTFSSRTPASVDKSSYIGEPVWSPDARRLRFDVAEHGVGDPVLWEVSLDGTNLHRLLPGWTSSPAIECCGKWTADGRYLLFPSRRQIWGVR